MPKYILFVYDSCGAFGGAHDCKGVFETLGQAIGYIEDRGGLQGWDNVDLCCLTNDGFEWICKDMVLFAGDNYTQRCFVNIIERSILWKGKKTKLPIRYNQSANAYQHVNTFEDKTAETKQK
jgi:hypothetical protein